MVYELGPFRLDAKAGALTHNGVATPLGARGVAVLAALVSRAGEYVERSVIVDAAWPGLVVEEANLSVQISAIRRVLARAPQGENWIETLTRRGYRFVGPVAAAREESSHVEQEDATDERSRDLVLPDKPSIAVLPFANMSGDASQEYFADGMAEEIITALSRIKWLFVIARTSSFTYKGKAVDVKRVGRELGVHYVLDGSVRKADLRVRITAQLIDALSGAHLRADRFEGSLEDVFELQDKVAISVAGAIEPTLMDAEIRRSVNAPTRDLTAYDLYLRAVSQSITWEKESLLAALGLLGQAIERDPHYAPALALAAALHVQLHGNNWGQDPETNRRSGVDLARRALQQVAGDDPLVLAYAGNVFAYFGEDIVTAIDLVDRALAVNPSFARGWVISAWLRLWVGQPELALSHLETALRLSPRAGGLYMAMGLAHFFSRRFEEAVALLLRSLQEHPNWPPTYRFLASCYAHMGRLDDARETVGKLRALTSDVVPSASHWRDAQSREFFLAGLRLAAGEQASPPPTPNPAARGLRFSSK